MKTENVQKHYFSSKDSTLLKLRKRVLYKTNGVDRGQSYIGKTERFFNIRYREHRRDVGVWKHNCITPFQTTRKLIGLIPKF